MTLCPVCHQADRTSQLFSKGWAASSGTKGGGFSPPEAPRYPRLERIIGFSLAILLLASGFIIFLVRDALIALFLMIAGFIYIACFLNDEKERRGAWLEKKIEWQFANEVWKSLYFCERDETIFNPENGEIILFDNLQNYIYQKA